MRHKILGYIKSHKYISLGVVALVIIIGLSIGLRGDGTTETTAVTEGDLVRTVSIAGKVIPKESADLSFEITGTISQVLNKVGDRVFNGETLVRLNANTLTSDLSKAEADLASAQAELNKLDGGSGYETEINNAKRSIVQAIIDAYTASDDAVYNKSDQFFNNPRGGRPEIFYAFQGYNDLRDSVNSTRVEVGEDLEKWKKLTSTLNLSNYSKEDLDISKSYLAEISLFISDVSRAVNIFEANDSLSQTTIDKYKADIITARNNLNTASQNLISKEDNLRNLLADIPVQVAKVESAQATVQSYRSKLSKTNLYSPIGGIVSKQDAKVGQVVSAGTTVVSVISSDYIIEAFIPEVSIGGVNLGDKATVTLDAYGDNQIFEAYISHIDPAETIKDGVSTYKVELSFQNQDEHIRSGMTANTEIETFKKAEVKMIKERAVIKENGESFVYLANKNDDPIKTKVEIGERDSNGNVELLSDLPISTSIVLNPTQTN